MAGDGKNINDIMTEYNLSNITKKERETLEMAAICGKFRERIKNGESFQVLAEEQGIREKDIILKLIAIAIENGHPRT